MNIYKTCLTCSLLIMVTACGKRSNPLNLLPDEGNPLAFLSVSCDVSDDPVGRAKALILTIENPSDRRLDNVSITFNDSYTAPLQNLRIHRVPIKGSPPLEESAILPGDHVRLIFSHDVSNHQSMTNQSGTTLPVTLVPTNITIRAEETAAIWSVNIDDSE